MQLDHENISDFELGQAYHRDSARRGASALDSSENRALEVDIARLQGKSVCQALMGHREVFRFDLHPKASARSSPFPISH